ncbi:MAG: galactose-1-phosphate uridylyltransferase [Acidobacteria bacterium]|nr:MAG: galactose-1-phosphate uridylyltransferase [Acidobacteriota bacterium]
MTEFRRDPHSGEWVTIAGSRQKRPALPDECPFCIGGLEAPESYSVMAFENRWPVMTPISKWGNLAPGSTETASLIDELRTSPLEWASGLTIDNAPYEAASAIGAAEVVLYTPEHEGSLGALADAQLEAVWNLWVERTAGLSSRQEIASVLIFENRGEEVGVTIHHPHCQIYAFPFVPPRQRQELEVAKARNRSDPSMKCVSCALAESESGGERLIAECESALAYVPYASAWPFAVHFMPRRHFGSITEMSTQEAAEMRGLMKRVLLAGDRIFDRPLPTMLAFLQAPTDGSDSANLWHMRIEVVSPMRKRGVLRYVAAAEVSSGTFANPVTPEDAARLWRDALGGGA